MMYDMDAVKVLSQMIVEYDKVKLKKEAELLY